MKKGLLLFIRLFTCCCTLAGGAEGRTPVFALEEKHNFENHAVIYVGVLIEIRLCIRVLVLEPGLDPFLYVVKARGSAGPYLVAALLQSTCDRFRHVVDIVALPVGDCCRGPYLAREEMLKAEGYPCVDVGGVEHLGIIRKGSDGVKGQACPRVEVVNELAGHDPVAGTVVPARHVRVKLLPAVAYLETPPQLSHGVKGNTQVGQPVLVVCNTVGHKVLDGVVVLDQSRHAREETIIEACADEVIRIFDGPVAKLVEGQVIAVILCLDLPPVGKAVSGSGVKEILMKRHLVRHYLNTLDGASRKAVSQGKLKAARRNEMEKPVGPVILVIVRRVLGEVDEADPVVEVKRTLSEEVLEADAWGDRGDEVRFLVRLREKYVAPESLLEVKLGQQSKSAISDFGTDRSNEQDG